MERDYQVTLDYQVIQVTLELLVIQVILELQVIQVRPKLSLGWRKRGQVALQKVRKLRGGLRTQNPEGHASKRSYALRNVSSDPGVVDVKFPPECGKPSFRAPRRPAQVSPGQAQPTFSGRFHRRMGSFRRPGGGSQAPLSLQNPIQILSWCGQDEPASLATPGGTWLPRHTQNYLFRKCAS